MSSNLLRVESASKNIYNSAASYGSAASVEPKRIPRLTGNYYHADVLKSRRMIE